MRRRLAVVAVAVALAGCARVPADVAPTASPGRSHQPTAMAPTAVGLTPGPSASPTAEPLTIAFAGDMNFEDETRARLDADPASVFGVAQQATRLADLTFGNLETSVGTSGNPESKAYTFQAPPAVFDALAIAGFDAVSMANNHVVDFGASALEETLRAIGATHVAVAGVGANAAAAYAPVFLVAKGRGSRSLRRRRSRRRRWGTGPRTTTVLASRRLTSGFSGPSRPPIRRPTSRSSTCTGGSRTRRVRRSCSSRPRIA
jgi:Bacterial capsule synthesis protein PGA_cap